MVRQNAARRAAEGAAVSYRLTIPADRLRHVRHLPRLCRHHHPDAWHRTQSSSCRFYGCPIHGKRGSTMCSNRVVVRHEIVEGAILSAISEVLDERLLARALDKGPGPSQSRGRAGAQ